MVNKEHCCLRRVSISRERRDRARKEVLSPNQLASILFVCRFPWPYASQSNHPGDQQWYVCPTDAVSDVDGCEQRAGLCRDRRATLAVSNGESVRV